MDSMMEALEGYVNQLEERVTERTGMSQKCTYEKWISRGMKWEGMRVVQMARAKERLELYHVTSLSLNTTKFSRGGVIVMWYRN